jgi:mRNA interferase RelE/StbE
MAYEITMTRDAEDQFRSLTVRERRTLEDAISARLIDQPTTVAKAIKRLRPNPLAEFELRVGDLRVLYNVEGEEVILLIVGRKVGNSLIVGGEEFHGHEDDSPESSGGGPSRDVE